MTLTGLVGHMVRNAAHKSGLVANPPHPYHPGLRCHRHWCFAPCTPHAVYTPCGALSAAAAALTCLPRTRCGRRRQRRALWYAPKTYLWDDSTFAPDPARREHNPYYQDQHYYDDYRYRSHQDDFYHDYRGTVGAPDAAVPVPAVERPRRVSFDDGQWSDLPPAYEVATATPGPGWSGGKKY